MRFFTKKNKSVLWLVMLTTVLMLAAVGCGKQQDKQASAEKEKEPIVFADAGWDSLRFHNNVAQFIIENGYGYPTDVIPGSTPATVNGLRNGDIDAYMEIWTDNIKDVYNEAIEKGEIVEVSTNFDDNKQGIYVPTYVIEGDPDRGIEPMAPDLKSVEDLSKYWEVFKDPEDPEKGRLIGAIPGWAVDETLHAKYENYGLDKTFNYFSPGSGTALATSITKAYENGEPWVGYYWEPTWIMGLYDMTLLEEDEYSEEKWNNGFKCAFPAQDITVAVNSELKDRAPEVVKFLSHYQTSSALTSEALAYMQENEVDTKEAAKWFLKEHMDLWSDWVPEDVANKVKEQL